MRTIPIQANLRERVGKGSARSARREGMLPGVLYGQGENVAISINRKEFATAMHEAHGENVIWDVAIDGREPLKSIAREIQHHPVNRHLIHVDFQHIDLSKPIQVSVVVHLTGEPEGVKTYGGILEHASRELEILVLPQDIPAQLDVDVSKLMIGDSIHVSDLPADGFEFVEEPARVVAQVAAPTVAKADDEEAEGAEGEEAAAEGEEKKEDAPQS